MTRDPANMDRAAIARALDENDRLIGQLADRVAVLERGQAGRKTPAAKPAAVAAVAETPEPDDGADDTAE